jgi:DNA-directed RNA polymerase specialized sigma24 family protein
MARLTSDELKALREKEDWQALWAYAVSWVKYVATTIKTNEREDMIQDALLVVGKAVPKWDPAKSQFPTYVRRVAKNAMLNHVYSKTYRAERTAALDVEDLDTDSGPMAGMGFTYGDTNYTPQGFGDPVSEIGREFAAESVEHFFKELDNLMALALREIFGLPVLDEQEEERYTLEVARANGLTRDAIAHRMEKLQEAARKTQSQRYTSKTQPEGKAAHRTHLEANRHPGFWQGMAGAMGDTDAWRESVGTVWKDWSWKPTDEDIMRGAKP